VLDHGQSSARFTNPATTGLSCDVRRRGQQMQLVHHHRVKATLEQMARPPEPSVDGPGVAPVALRQRSPAAPPRPAGVTPVGIIGRWM
jgi:hypothetical protein